MRLLLKLQNNIARDSAGELIAFIYNQGKIPFFQRHITAKEASRLIQGGQVQGINKDEVIAIAKVICKVCTYMSIVICPVIDKQ